MTPLSSNRIAFLTVKLAHANQRIADLEAALRQAEQAAAEAKAQVRNIIETDLALDDAMHDFVPNLSGQVADLQENLDLADADIDAALNLVDERNRRIARL